MLSVKKLKIIIIILNISEYLITFKAILYFALKQL